MEAGKCDRCGLVETEPRLLDLDTGSICHPEPGDCIKRLKERYDGLVLSRARLQAATSTYVQALSNLVRQGKLSSEEATRIIQRADKAQIDVRMEDLSIDTPQTNKEA